MGISVFGIKNCDQVRKARKFLASNDIPYEFHDFRADGLTGETLDRWLSHVPWDSLLNRRGATWRKMGESARQAVVDQQSARDAMLAEPTLIKRPVMIVGDDVLVGFSESVYRRTLKLPSP